MSTAHTPRADLDDEDDRDEEEIDPADAPPPPPAPADEAPPQRPRRPRAPRAGVGGAPPDGSLAAFESHMAIDLVGEVLDRLQRFPGLGKPWDFNVQVLTMDGRDRRFGDRVLGSFSLYRLEGVGGSPGERLQDMVTDLYHFPRTDQPDTYDIRILHAKNGRVFARSRLSLGGREEITAIRRQQAEAEKHGRPPPPPPATGYGAPAPSYAAPPGYAPAWQQPAPAAPSGDINELRGALERERYELQRTQGMLEEALRASREGRAPAFAVPPAAGIGAPPAPPAPAESVEATIVRVLQQYGVIKAPAAQGFGAPPPAPAAAPPLPVQDRMTAMLKEGMEQAVFSMIEQGLGSVTKAMGSAMRAVTEPGAPADEEEPPEAPPDPSERMPFDLVAVKAIDGTAAKWPDGSGVMYPIDRVTGDISGKGALIGNPFITSKAMEVVQTLAEAGKAFASRVRLPDGNTVVSRTPAGAVDAGMGAAPARNHAPPPPPPPQAPSPGPNGAAGGGGFPVM